LRRVNNNRIKKRGNNMKNNTSELSRRNFLKGAGIGAATLVGASGVSALTGCSPQSANEPAATGGSSDATANADTSQPSYMNRPAVGEPEETVQADFIVCGAGGAGMAATLQADDLGLNVILLEKKAQAGGTFVFAGAHFAPNSKHAIEAGIETDIGELIKTLLVYNHFIPSHALLNNYVNETSETVEWCESLGCKFELRTRTPVALRYVGESAGGATLSGATLIKTLISEAENRGLDIRYSTPAQELTQDASGKVTGVLATDDSGKVIKFEAPAVCLCTGGWGSNPDFLRGLARVNPDRVITSGYDGRDGDGVYMARKAGTAWARGDGTIMFYGPHLSGATWGEHLFVGIYQPLLWVDHKGNRFMNEGGGNFAETGSAIRDLKRMLIIQTQADLDRLATGAMVYDNGTGLGAEGTALTEFKDMLQQQIDAGNEYIFIANTIEELATATGLDSATFKATVDRYNDLVDKGVDEDFNKDPSYLTPLKEGPFYAFDCFNGFYTTVGGVSINADLQAVDDNGDVIEGLYIGGCDTGSLCGDIYDFTSAPGEQSSWALNSGRMAAKHVAKVLGK
jgi:fumarate reductase flavoprotein subunit